MKNKILEENREDMRKTFTYQAALLSLSLKILFAEILNRDSIELRNRLKKTEDKPETLFFTEEELDELFGKVS